MRGTLGWLGVALAAVCGARVASAQGVRGGLISEVAANRVGLHRAWVSQASLDANEDRLESLSLQSGLILVQTKLATVQVIDAESGRTLWTRRYGKRGDVCVAPAANEKYVAIVNGQTMYVLHRHNGGLVWEQKLQHIPGGSIAMNDRFVYLPLLRDGLLGMPIDRDSDDDAPWFYGSGSLYDLPPVITGKSVAWTSRRGDVYVGELDKAEARFRFRAGGPIDSPLAAKSPYLFACSRDGYVYSFHEMNKLKNWEFSAGVPIYEAPVAIDESVFVSTYHDGMYSLDTLTGGEQWFAPHAAHFVAASQKRLYATDDSGLLFVLNRATGQRLTSLDTRRFPHRVANLVNDRLYLSDAFGMIQCFHETRQEEPWLHNQPKKKEDPAAEPPMEGMPPPAGENPFGGEPKPAEPKPAEPKPAENADNPFN